MTTKRIRCSCGRVYDPVKRPVCPDCGAPHVAAEPAPAPEVPPIAEEPNEQSRKSVSVAAPVSPRLLASGAGLILLLVVIFAISRCGSKEKRPPEPTPSLSPTATATAAPVSTATPVPTATPAAVVPGLTSDLNALISKSEEGATINLPPGVYPGGLLIKKALRLVGVSGQVFIQSDGRECLSVRAAGVSFQNVQFTCSGIGELPAISVADGAALELEGCKIQSNTAVAVTVAGNATLKTLGGTFSAPNGVALRLTNGARALLTQSSFNDSRIGIWLAQAASAELHSCALERDGGEDAKGAIVTANGSKTNLSADDCHFTSNTGGISAIDGASLSLTNCTFNNNGVTPRAGGVVGLVAIYNNSLGKIESCVFEANEQGVAVGENCKFDVSKCQFNGTGVRQMSDVIPSCQPLSAFGKEALLTVRDTSIFDSAQYGILSLAGGKAVLENVEISGTRSVGLVVGDRTAGAGAAEIRRSRFRNNGNGIGIFAASSATIEDSEFRENQDGVIVLDQGSNLRGTKLKFIGNRDAGLFVHALGQASVTDSDFQGNARGFVAGVKGKPAERASATLEDCRFSENRTFAAGACQQSELVLTRCVFESSNKLNLFKERSAKVQLDAPPAEDSPSPSDDSTTASPTPTARPHSRPRPRSRRPSDAERILRNIFGPG